jgi:hypothetical protein
VFARSKSQDAKSRAKAGATRVKGRARQATKQATKQVAPLAKSAQTQFTPLAKSAQMTANRGVYGARIWAAPRVHRSGMAVQERLAPKVSSMMTATARRIQPPQAKQRRRWPGIIAGTVAVAAGCVAAVLLRGKRESTMSGPDSMNSASGSPQMPAAGSPDSERERVDVNGQARTP